MNFFTHAHVSNTKLFFLLFLLSISAQGHATVWTTIATGPVSTLSNWSNGTSSPTTFATPGDTWNVTLPMTIASGSPWTVGTPSSAPVNVNLMAGGDITGGAGGFVGVFNIYGNMNIADSITINGGGCELHMNVFGNYSQTNGSVSANGGAAILVYNINGNFSMTNGSIISQGGAASDTFNIKGNFSMSGPSYLSCVGGGAVGYVYLSLPTPAGTMMIDNTSTGSWSSNSVRILGNCTGQLAGNFGFASPNTFTVDGTLVCPAPHEVNGVGKFDLSPFATLTVGHATGINGAITCSSTRIFSTNANYGFNGTVAQVTGTDMPAALIAPDTITINNPMGVTLSQTTSTTGKLKFVNGKLNTGSFTMTVPGATASVFGAGLTNYVNGTLIKTATGLSSINFEVGDTSYAPMLLTFNAAATSGSIGMKVNNGLHPNIATSGLTTSYITTHYWTATNIGLAGPGTVTPKATYNLSTIVSGTNISFRTQKYSSAAWLSTARVSTNTTAPYTTTADTGFALASFAGDYVFGRVNIPSLDVNSVSKSDEVKIFPNPNKGTFTLLVNAVADEDVQVVITDVLGRTIKEFSTATNKITGVELDVATGVYLLSARGKNESYSGRIAIE